MTVETRETSEHAAPSIGDRMADVARHVAHLSHEARMVRSMAEDAVEDGVYNARRAVKTVRRRIERLEDMKDGLAYYVKRRPLRTIAMAAGLGLLVGVTAGLIAGRSRKERADGELS